MEEGKEGNPLSPKDQKISLSLNIEDREGETNSIHMDDHEKEKKQNNNDEGALLNVRDVLSAIWLRLSIQIDNGFVWFILGGRHYILFYFRIILFLIFVAVQMAKK